MAIVRIQLYRHGCEKFWLVRPHHCDRRSHRSAGLYMSGLRPDPTPDVTNDVAYSEPPGVLPDLGPNVVDRLAGGLPRGQLEHPPARHVLDLVDMLGPAGRHLRKRDVVDDEPPGLVVRDDDLCLPAGLLELLHDPPGEQATPPRGRQPRVVNVSSRGVLTPEAVWLSNGQYW